MKIGILAVANNIHARRWVNALADRGIEVTLFSQHRAPASSFHEGVRIVQLPWQGAFGYIFNAFALRRAVARSGIDFLHIHYAGGNAPLALLAGIRRFVVSVWGGDVYNVPGRGPLHRVVVRRLLQKALRITSTSHVMARQVHALGVEAPVDVIAFGVDTNMFAPARDSDADRGRLIIGTVKTLKPKYGIDTLIQGFAIACGDPGFAAQRPMLRIAGGGTHGPQYQQLAERLGIADRILFLGEIDHDDVPSTLRDFDIFVAASRDASESFGVAVIEASACGLPVIVSDVGGLPEVVRDNATGLIIPHDDPRALSHALIKLASDSALRSALGHQGREFVRTHYEWRDNVDQMIALYRQVGMPASAAPASAIAQTKEMYRPPYAPAKTGCPG